MRRVFWIVALAGAGVAGALATAHARAIPEVRPFVGAFVPTGAQRDALKDTWLVGGQAALEVADFTHLVGSFGWATNRRSKDVCVYDYTAGVEGFQPLRMTDTWEARPFLGLGLGGRTYVDHGNGDHKEITWGGYGALGTEFQLDRFAVRIEGRDYVTRFRGLTGDDKAKARNDLTFATGVAFHW